MRKGVRSRPGSCQKQFPPSLQARTSSLGQGTLCVDASFSEVVRVLRVMGHTNVVQKPARQHSGSGFSRPVPAVASTIDAYRLCPGPAACDCRGPLKSPHGSRQTGLRLAARLRERPSPACLAAHPVLSPRWPQGQWPGPRVTPSPSRGPTVHFPGKAGQREGSGRVETVPPASCCSPVVPVLLSLAERALAGICGHVRSVCLAPKPGLS